MTETGLEIYAMPLLYTAGATTFIASWLTVARWRAEAFSTRPEMAVVIRLALAFAGTAMVGTGLLGATLLDPKTNHLPLAALMWVAGTLAPILFCAKPTN